jgi:hypothetical protein
MTTSHRNPDATQQPGTDSYRTPRWVKVFAGIGVALVVTFVVLHLAGRGFRHQHAALGAPAARTGSSNASEPAQRP